MIQLSLLATLRSFKLKEGSVEGTDVYWVSALGQALKLALIILTAQPLEILAITVSTFQLRK